MVMHCHSQGCDGKGERGAACPRCGVTLGLFAARTVNVMPFRVRASCGHIEIRKMREATAGVPYSEDVVLEAPNGRACGACEGA